MDAFLFQNLVRPGALPEDGPQNHRRPAAYFASPWLGYPHEDVPPCHFSDYLGLRGWDKDKLKRGLWRRARPDNVNLSDDDCVIAAVRVVQSWLTFGFLESVFECRVEVNEYTRNVGIASNASMDYMWQSSGRGLLPQFYGLEEMSELPMFYTKNLVSNMVSLSNKHQTVVAPGTDPERYARRFRSAFVEFVGALQSFNSLDVYKKESLSGPMFLGPKAKVRAFLHSVVMRDKEESSSMVNVTDPDSKFGSILPWVLAFPALLGATVQLHLASLVPDVEITEPRLVTNLIMKQLVLQSGWCPYTLERLRVTTQYTVLYWLWACGFEDVTMKSHSECDETACKAYRISDESLYPTQHVNKCNGSCAIFHLDMDRITRTYESGAFPVITVSHNSDPSKTCPYVFDIADADPSNPSAIPYTAFSHVWIDGFGSTTEQGMPMCQMEFLGHAASVVSVAESKTTSFWIDSLCIPGDRRLRERAIMLMTNVYKSAALVVVLDKTLQKLSIKVSIEELMLRIYTSPWMTRVWTYQEGVLAVKLYFQMSDTYCPFNFPTREVAVLQTHDVYINLRNQLQCLEGAVEPLGISRIINEVRWRDTLHRDPNGKNDELIAVGVLLGLDMSTLLKAKGYERMTKFLLLVKKLPRDIIFSHVGRLQEEGFRWAPSTFLVQDDRRLTTDLEHNGVVCTPNGLLGRYLVFKISVSQSISGSPSKRLSIVDRRSQRWFEFVTMDNDATPVDFDHIIIHPEALPDSTHGTIFVGVAVLKQNVTERPHLQRMVEDHSVDLVCQYQRILCLFNLREVSGLNYAQDSWPGLVEGLFQHMKILLR